MYLIVGEYVYEFDGTFGHSVVFVVERRYDTWKMPERRDLVSQLGLSTKEAHRCRGNRLQHLTLRL